MTIKSNKWFLIKTECINDLQQKLKYLTSCQVFLEKKILDARTDEWNGRTDERRWVQELMLNLPICLFVLLLIVICDIFELLTIHLACH